MKKYQVSYSSYLLFILSLAFTVNELYLPAFISFVVSVALLALLIEVNKDKFHFRTSDSVFLFIQLILLSLFKTAFTRVSPVITYVAVVSIIFNSIYIVSLRTLKTAHINFFIRILAIAFSALIVVVSIGYIYIYFSMELTELASIGLLYLLIINYTPLIYSLLIKERTIIRKTITIS